MTRSSTSSTSSNGRVGRISRLVATTGIASAILLGSLATPAATFARGSSGVRAIGACSLRSTSALKAKYDNGRIEVELEVDQNRNDQLWTVRLFDDGIRVFTGLRRTAAPSGSFSITRWITNRAGMDTIVARAVNSTTGEVCRAWLNI
jgi:hypothetical protein